MRVKIVLLGERGERTSYRLKKLPTIIGRGRDADLTLAHPLASRHHCELYEVDGTLCVRDLGSLNGTFVGDFRVTEAALETGDLLIVGGAKFEVQVEKEPEAIMPPRPTGKPVAAADIVELETVGDAVGEGEDAFSDIDFAEVEPSEPNPVPAAADATRPAPSKPKGKPASPGKAQSTKPKEAPGKPETKEAAAESGPPSDLDLGNLNQEATGAPTGDDSGLNSFLRKLE